MHYYELNASTTFCKYRRFIYRVKDYLYVTAAFSSCISGRISWTCYPAWHGSLSDRRRWCRKLWPPPSPKSWQPWGTLPTTLRSRYNKKLQWGTKWFIWMFALHSEWNKNSLQVHPKSYLHSSRHIFVYTAYTVLRSRHFEAPTFFFFLIPLIYWASPSPAPFSPSRGALDELLK